MSQQNKRIFAFGSFCFDPHERLLLRDNQPIPLTPKVADTLQVLLENPGRLVDKEELMRRIWPDAVVEEGNLNKNIFVLRKALGKFDGDRDYIETVPKRGYRFLPPVTVSASSGPAGPSFDKSPAIASTFVQPGTLSASPRRWLSFAAIALPAVLAVAYAFSPRRSPPPEFNLSGFRMTPLTHSGAVTSVAVSPDGNYVAYVRWTSDGQQSLWVRQLAAQSDLQIVPPVSGLYGSAFSSDGNFVYFLRYSDLYSVPVIGGAAKKIFADVASPVSFSPDGRHFVFERHIAGRDEIEVRIAATEGGDDHLLASLHEASSMLVQRGPAWSPDGRTLAIPILAIGPRIRWALELVSVDDGNAHAANASAGNSSEGNVRELFSTMRPLGHPVWLRDDLLLIPAYEAEIGRGQLWSVSLPDGRQQRLTNDLTSYGSVLDDYGFPLDRSRDGLSLVALSTTQTGSIWAAPRSDPAKALRFTDNEPPLNNVSEAADGKLWASSADGRLWNLLHDGSRAVPFGKFGPIAVIEPCGRFLVLQQGVSLTRLDADAGHPFDLAQGTIFSPACSPDGKFVFYATADRPQKIWRVPLEGGTPVEVAPMLGEQAASRLSISPDGKFICYAYQKPDSAQGTAVAIVSVEGGSLRQTIALGTEWQLSWSPDGKALQILDTSKGVSNIWEQPLSGGAPRQVTTFQSGRIFDFRWSPDWGRLLMTRGEISSDAILLTARP
jgi:DNA-binding winged helix-turn-helix (wHTH) protein/Tol biopolymer transport system component